MNERDMRDMRGMDGRRLPPRNARGEFMSRGRGRGRRGDRGMDYGMDGRIIRSYPNMYPQGDYARGDMNYDMARGGRGRGGRSRGDYGEYDMARGEDMRSMDYRGGDYRGGQMSGDGHYMHGRQSGYEPVEFMGYCQGYYGSPEQDYGRGRDYGYDMRGRRDYGYDYGYDYGDYGEVLSEQELEKWNKKLLEQLDEREKQMFSKEQIMQRAKAMNKPMEGFGEKELYTATLMWYTDNKEFFGQNVDFAVKGGYAFLADKDTKVRGAEKLCVYYDEIVMGGED